MEILFILSRESLPLAVAEVKARYTGKQWSMHGRGLRCTLEKFEEQPLAFTKEAHEVICSGDEQEIIAWLSKQPHSTKATVKVETNALGERMIAGSAARKLLIPWLQRPRVDLKDPQETYCLISSKHAFFVTKKLWMNQEQFSKRANQYRPAPHPTSLSPKLARAMINLTHPKNEVLDPFCGSGGILIEAGLLGLKARGNDIDPAMIARAEKNCAFCQVTPTLEIKDALTLKEKAEVIVTDVPYGRNSKAKDLEQLYKEFLQHTKKLTKRMVVGFPDLVDVDALLKDAGWQVKEKFVWELHKTLKKIIVVLELA